MGRVTKITPGLDGLVRSVEVKTTTSVFVRPVTKLCFLESSAEEESYYYRELICVNFCYKSEM